MSMRLVAGGALIAVVLSQTGRAQSPPAQAAAPAAPAAQAAAPDLSCPELATAVRAAATNDVRLRDWPAMARYREANKTVTGADVVFMGDSITDVWQQAQFGPYFTKKGYVDRGISGQTTPQMLLRFRPDVLNLKPKVVVILAGTNDIAGNTGPMTNEEIEGNLQSMAELASAAGIKVVLASITPVSAYHAGRGAPQTTQRPMSRITAINTWLKSYAAAHKHVYLDYFSAMTDPSGMLRTELSNDDLHPTKAGYDIMGPLADAAIARALGR